MGSAQTRGRAGKTNTGAAEHGNRWTVVVLTQVRVPDNSDIETYNNSESVCVWVLLSLINPTRLQNFIRLKICCLFSTCRFFCCFSCTIFLLMRFILYQRWQSSVLMINLCLKQYYCCSIPIEPTVDLMWYLSGAVHMLRLLLPGKREVGRWVLLLCLFCASLQEHGSRLRLRLLSNLNKHRIRAYLPETLSAELIFQALSSVGQM